MPHPTSIPKNRFIGLARHLTPAAEWMCPWTTDMHIFSIELKAGWTPAVPVPWK
jgi:hypothetical protein